MPAMLINVFKTFLSFIFITVVKPAVTPTTAQRKVESEKYSFEMQDSSEEWWNGDKGSGDR